MRKVRYTKTNAYLHRAGENRRCIIPSVDQAMSSQQETVRELHCRLYGKKNPKKCKFIHKEEEHARDERARQLRIYFHHFCVPDIHLGDLRGVQIILLVPEELFVSTSHCEIIRRPKERDDRQRNSQGHRGLSSLE